MCRKRTRHLVSSGGLPVGHDHLLVQTCLTEVTEDNLLPGFRFKVPMMIVLDTLKNEDPCLRRIGETWMRCSLKSYLR
jgi:hypothetical protein